MIFYPAVIALFLSSVLTSFLMAYSSSFAVLIHRKWDLRSGSELQLLLERRTYLISTILTYVLAFQVLSFFLYIYTADRLHPLFVGAMCAAGTLQVNAYGYPALVLKILNCLLAGVWLVLNCADNRAFDYPLIRKKYLFLLSMAPFVFAETYLQAAYFLNLQPNIITSCCGSLFSVGENTFTSEIASLPVRPMMVAYYFFLGATAASGFFFYYRLRGGYLFSFLGAAGFLVSVAALVSFISLYYYELPTHHCPFCILQKEYGHVGYLLYFLLFAAGVGGLGVGALMPFRQTASLASLIPVLQRKLVRVVLAAYLLFAFLITWKMIFTDFTLGDF